jgi:pyrimidine-nucleoside phosphorylase
MTYELIRKKREGETLTPEEIQFLIQGFTLGEVPDYQMSAFLMAVCLKGMTFEETKSLTLAMMSSGETLSLSEIPGPTVDKHSTGGVGDKTSLLLTPMVASCGVPVPMMSGRGLGHTGGTLDKLESIPGFRTRLLGDEFIEVLSKVGCVMAGQTERMVPADRKLYALRDVTATVESIPLVASSIMSKKLTEGADALVLDVKTGSGAFFPEREKDLELARTMIAIGRGMGRKVVALITDMSQPLGFSVGNALEVKEALWCLSGGESKDLMDLTYALGAEMLLLGGRAKDLEEGTEMLRDVVKSGKALSKFRRLVEAQGGDVRVVDDPGLLPQAVFVLPVLAPKDGYIARMNCLEVGLASVALGAGRMRLEDEIDPAAGLVFTKKVGDRVRQGAPMAFVHSNYRVRGDACVRRITDAVQIEETAFKPPLILERLSE